MEQQPHVTRRKQSRFRPLHSFNLRTLFAVVTSFGVWLGWQVNVVRERNALIAKLQQSVGIENVHYQWLEEWEAGRSISAELQRIRVSRLRACLGDRSYIYLDISHAVESQLLEQLDNAFPEAVISLRINKNERYKVHRNSLLAPTPGVQM